MSRATARDEPRAGADTGLVLPAPAAALLEALRVVRLGVDPYRLVLRQPWSSARGESYRRQGWLLRLEVQGGRCGWGDCAPWPAAGTESPSRAAAALKVLAAGRGLSLAGLLARAPCRGCVRFACETAVLDVLGQVLGCPIRDLLNPAASGRVAVNAALGRLDAGTPVRLGVAADQGYRTVKIKLGLRPMAEELSRLERLLQQCGSQVDVRVDVNGAWSLRYAARALRRCAQWPLEAMEEPSDAACMRVLARWQEGVIFPLAADERLARLRHRPGAVRRWILKPSVHGLADTLRLVRRARTAGVQVVFTSLLESGIGLTAVAQVAAALGCTDVAHGLGTAAWLAQDTAPAPVGEGGTLALSEGPGLGVRPYSRRRWASVSSARGPG